jgi:sec-independent protein translocase protein TatA
MRGDKVVIGPLELAIIAVILLVIFGARYLPQLGRSAGKGVRIGSEKGKELAAVAQERAKDVDTKAIARQAGDHVREARELRDVVKGESPAKTKEKTAEAPPPTPSEAEKPASDADPRSSSS